MDKVLFSDEPRFNLSFTDGKQRVWRRPGECVDEANVIERHRYGGGSVMIWGGISHRQKSGLITIVGSLKAAHYCNEVIDPIVLPYLRQRHAAIFQQDNARPYSARHTRDHLQQNNVHVLDWPARSPDLSPIEHLWDHLGQKVKGRNDVNNVRDLARALHQEWQRITLQTIRHLISSTHRRCNSVIHVHGGHTGYLFFRRINFTSFL